MSLFNVKSFFTKNYKSREFPGGPVVKTQRFHCQDPGSIPSRGTNIPQAMQCSQIKKKKKL